MNKTVVIIDDDADDLDIMKDMLESVDPTVLCVSFRYPDEAIRLLTKDFAILPDYIFIDVNMPRLTGKQCLDELRKARALDESIISMYSTSMPAPVAQALLEKKANYAFQKPNALVALRNVIEAIIFKTGFHELLYKRYDA